MLVGSCNHAIVTSASCRRFHVLDTRADRHSTGGFFMRRNQVQVICAQCGNIFERKASEAAKRRNNFCNLACKAAWQSIHKRGENNHRYNGGGKSVACTCEQCGKTYNSYPSDKTRFCSQDCWNIYRQPDEQTHICLCCGKVFARNPRKNRIPKYCSQACRDKHLVLSPPREPIPLKIHICETCGNEFRERRHIKRKYCSKACNDIGRIGKPTKKENRKSETRHCLQCNKSFVEFLSQPRKFCCHACYAQWQSDNLSGENSYGWQGGAIDYRGPNWNEQADKTRARDNYMCRHCGKFELLLGQSLDVHHIVPFRQFGIERYMEANELNNLVSLCRSCHLSIERGGTTCNFL